MIVVGFLLLLLLAGLAGVVLVVRDSVQARPVPVPLRPELVPDPCELRARRLEADPGRR